MNCPVCNEEFKTSDDKAMLSCNGSTWAPHDLVSYTANDGAFHVTSPAMVTWFRENGYQVTYTGSYYLVRQKKSVISRILHR